MSDSRILVTGYICPDLDAYACSLAYAELLRDTGKDAAAGSYGKPLAEVDFILDYTDAKLLPDPDPLEFDSIIAVDNSRISNMDPRIDPSNVIEVIDHRSGSDQSIFPNAKWQIDLVGAAATLITEKFRAANVEPNPDTAAFLLAAIISNTLNFKFFQTTERDHQMAEYLGSVSKAPKDFAHQLYAAKSDLSGDKLARQLRDDFSVTDPVNGRTIGLGQIELINSPKVVNSRLNEILTILNDLQRERRTDFILTTLADVESGKTYFISDHQPSQDLLHQALGLSFDKNIAEHNQLLLRKQYFHKLKALL